MRIHHLRAEAFGPFATEVSVDLDALSDAGLFLLTGATGAGKTSVLDAICFALYGAVPGDRQAAKRLRSDHAAEGVAPSVSMEFTVQGRRFLIDRSPAWQRPKKRGAGRTTEQASVLVRERIDGEWRALSTRLDEAGHLVTGLLGMNLTQFCQVQLLPQGRFQAFLRADSDERHRLLQQLFRTGRFEDVEAWLRERRARAAAGFGAPPRDRRRPRQPGQRGCRRAAARRLGPARPGAGDDAALHLGDSLATASALADDAARERVARHLGCDRRPRPARDRSPGRGAPAAARPCPGRGGRARRRRARPRRPERRLEAGRRAAAVLPLAEFADRALADLRAAESLAGSRLTRVGTLLGLTDPSGRLTGLATNATPSTWRRGRVPHAPRVIERDRLQQLVASDATRGEEVAAALEAANARLVEVPDEIARRRTTEAAAARAADALPRCPPRPQPVLRTAATPACRWPSSIARRLEADDLLRQAVDRAQTATQEWLDLQELRLTGHGGRDRRRHSRSGASLPGLRVGGPSPAGRAAAGGSRCRGGAGGPRAGRRRRGGAAGPRRRRLRPRGPDRQRPGARRPPHRAGPRARAGRAPGPRVAAGGTRRHAARRREAREAAERELDELTRRRAELSAERARIEAGAAERADRIAAHRDRARRAARRVRPRRRGRARRPRGCRGRGVLRSPAGPRASATRLRETADAAAQTFRTARRLAPRLRRSVAEARPPPYRR